MKNRVGKDSVVYSFGIGEDVSFDLFRIDQQTPNR